MTSFFQDCVNQDIEDVFLNMSEFADQVTYDDTVNQKQIKAVFDFGTGFDTAHPKDTATVFISKLDVPDPDYRHKIIRSGVTWYVARDAPQSGVGVEKNGLWEIKVTTNERYKLQAPW